MLGIDLTVFTITMTMLTTFVLISLGASTRRDRRMGDSESVTGSRDRLSLPSLTSLPMLTPLLLDVCRIEMLAAAYFFILL